MLGIVGVDDGDPVVDAEPLELMVILFHQVVEHGPPLADQLGQVSAGFLVSRVFLNVHHEQDYPLAHGGALNGSAAVVVDISLELLDRLTDSKPEDFAGSGIGETKNSLDTFAGIL